MHNSSNKKTRLTVEVGKKSLKECKKYAPSKKMRQQQDITRREGKGCVLQEVTKQNRPGKLQFKLGKYFTHYQ